MFDVRWLECTNPLEDNIKSVGDFFSRCGLEDHKEDILALDRAHRAILDELATVKERLEYFYLKDQTSPFIIKTDNFGNIVPTDIDIVGDVHTRKDWLKYHLKYRLGDEKSWGFCNLENAERVFVRALVEREQELIDSSEKLAREIIDLMSKGQ